MTVTQRWRSALRSVDWGAWIDVHMTARGSLAQLSMCAILQAVRKRLNHPLTLAEKVGRSASWLIPLHAAS